MATKSKTKKTVIPQKDTEEPLKEAIIDGCTDAPYDKPNDTNISKKIYDIIEREYPRTRVGTDGWLHAILCELIRARLSK